MEKDDAYDNIDELLDNVELLSLDSLETSGQTKPPIDARRRLESLLEERKLRQALDDYADYE